MAGDGDGGAGDGSGWRPLTPALPTSELELRLGRLAWSDDGLTWTGAPAGPGREPAASFDPEPDVATSTGERPPGDDPTSKE